MTINRKIYVLNAVIWIGGIAILVALLWWGGAWLMHKWNFPGLP